MLLYDKFCQIIMAGVFRLSCSWPVINNKFLIINKEIDSNRNISYYSFVLILVELKNYQIPLPPNYKRHKSSSSLSKSLRLT